MTIHRECDLSLGEMVRLYRRRMGFSRAQLGAELKETKYWVGDVERGTREMPRERITWHGDRNLTGAERCWVMRTRCGRSQAEVAADLGVSRLWVNKMERGLVNADTLIWYWES